MTERRGDGRRRQPSGQSMVEFALVLPVFLLIVFGLIDAGRLVFMNSTLSQASREAARTASVEAYWVGRTDPSCGTFGGPVCPADTATLKAHMTAAANQMMAPFGTIPGTSIHVICGANGSAPPSGAWTAAVNAPTCTGRQAQDLVSVRAVMTFQPLTPIAGSLIGPITLVGAATMVIN